MNSLQAEVWIDGQPVEPHAPHDGVVLLGSGMRVDLLLDCDAAAGSRTRVIDEFDRVDVVVNNAGITSDNLLMRMKPDEWLSVVNTNLNGLYRIVKPVLRGMMKARFGRIINVSSVVARMGNPGQSNYVASKSGIEGFTRSLAQEVGSRGITVNAVAPGFIETDMTKGMLSNPLAKKMTSRTFNNTILLRRPGKAEEIAKAVLFLASDASSYVTGATFTVDGGITAAYVTPEA